MTKSYSFSSSSKIGGERREKNANNLVAGTILQWREFKKSRRRGRNEVDVSLSLSYSLSLSGVFWDLHAELSRRERKPHPSRCYFISAQSVDGLIQSGKRQPDTATNFSNRVSLTKSCSRGASASVHV